MSFDFALFQGQIIYHILNQTNFFFQLFKYEVYKRLAQKANKACVIARHELCSVKKIEGTKQSIL